MGNETPTPNPTQISYPNQPYLNNIQPRIKSRSNSRQRQQHPMLYYPNSTSLKGTILPTQLYSTNQTHKGSPNQPRYHSPARQLPKNMNNITLPINIQVPSIPRTPQMNTQPLNQNHQKGLGINDSFWNKSQENKSQDNTKPGSAENVKSNSIKIEQTRNKLKEQLNQGNVQLPSTLNSNLKISFL